MRKIFVFLIAAVLFMSFAAASAEDLGVQVIGGKNSDMEILSLDDMQLEQSYEIAGYAVVEPKSFEFVNLFPYYYDGKAGDNSFAQNHGAGLYVKSYEYYFNSIGLAESGENADYAWLLIDLTNLRKIPVKFMEEATVKVVYDDDYEYAGWVRQFNYDYDTRREYSTEALGTFIRAAISGKDEEALDMVYTGHYVFGCTLPNAVVNSKKPLRMVIQLGENELTYNIRK